MVDETQRKPPGNPATKRPSTRPAEPGHVAEDDRGNMTWQWANDAALQADDTAGAIERLRALVDPTLDVVDDDAPDSLQHNPKGLKVGYNPYNSGALGKTERKKKKSLRELSNWIETRRAAEAKKEKGE